MLTRNFIISIIFYLSGVLSLKLPIGIKPCLMNAVNDSCLSKAIAEAFTFLAKGNRQLGIPLLEPLAVKEIKIAGNGGQVNLDQVYHNFNLSGHTKTTIKNANFTVNTKNCLLTMESLTPSLRLEGSYRFKGRIYLLPINGHGPANITLVNLKAKNRLTCKIEGDFLKILHWKAEYAPEHVVFDIVNLFDGNPELSKQILKVIEENVLEVFDSMRYDYEKSFGELYASIANQFFSRIKYRHIFLRD